jgi:hypothetical protein
VIDKLSGSVDVPAGILEKVVHHDRVPQLDVIVLELGMRRELDPIILNHVLKRIIATERGQPALTGELFDVRANDVVHAVLLEGAVLVPDHLELTVDLPKQEPTLYELKREVVELEYLKIPTHEPGIGIGGKLPSSYLRKDPTANLDDHPGDVERE